MMLDRPNQVLLASASRSTITNSPDQGYNAKGGMFILNVTVAPGGEANLEMQLEVKDPVSDVYVPFTDFEPVTPIVSGGNSTFIFVVYPNEAGTYTAPNMQHIASPLPAYRWRAKVIPYVGSFTYSLSVVFML